MFTAAFVRKSIVSTDKIKNSLSCIYMKNLEVLFFRGFRGIFGVVLIFVFFFVGCL